MIVIYYLTSEGVPDGLDLVLKSMPVEVSNADTFLKDVRKIIEEHSDNSHFRILSPKSQLVEAFGENRSAALLDAYEQEFGDTYA